MITYDESIFSANNNKQKVQTLNKDSILRPKRKEKRIIILDFLLLQSQLNLFFLSFEQQKHLTNLNIFSKAITYFEYEKTEEKYQTGEYLLDEIIKKALPIAQVLFLEYELLFIFDNTTNHFIYAKNVL